MHCTIILVHPVLNIRSNSNNLELQQGQKVTIIMCVLQMACPASTELEVIVMDWLGKMLQLPQEFLSEGKG